MKQRTAEQNSALMKNVKASGSKIEVVLQRDLWRRGLRYRKNLKSVTGKPDICFVKAKIAIFCDSEFWHGYDWENRKNDFKSNKNFWIPKIERNMARDLEVNDILKSDGWIVLRYWGKDIIERTTEIADEIERMYRERVNGND